jgi:hypothetical protein
MRRGIAAGFAALLVHAILVLASSSAPQAGTPASPPQPASRLANAREVRQQLGLGSGFERTDRIETVRVAVLDHGFAGMEGTRRYLPENAILVEHYDPDFIQRYNLGDPAYRKGFEPGNAHGRVMAQIIWAVSGLHSKGPQFFLLNANGPTMLRRAIRYAVEQQVDLILFSSTFEGGGNGDGRGPINQAVSEAMRAGIVWVNAAGNYGGRVYNGPIEVRADNSVRIGPGTDSVSLRFRNRLDENPVTITLTWNDYQKDEDAGTEKDLDLFVEDWRGRLLGSSEQHQVSGGRPAGEGESRNPRERLVLDSMPADPDHPYRIRIRSKHGAFNATDTLRVLVAPGRDMPLPDPKTRSPIGSFEFIDATAGGEIYPPADHPLVVTVGDASRRSSMGPTADRRVKPDVILEGSEAILSNGEVSEGASNAAAFFAGALVVYKAVEPKLTAQHVLGYAKDSARQVATVRSYKPVRLPNGILQLHPVQPTSREVIERRRWRPPTRLQLAELVRGV